MRNRRVRIHNAYVWRRVALLGSEALGAGAAYGKRVLELISVGSRINDFVHALNMVSNEIIYLNPA